MIQRVLEYDSEGTGAYSTRTLVGCSEQLSHGGSHGLRGGTQLQGAALHRFSRKGEEPSLLSLPLGLRKVSGERLHCINGTVDLQRPTHLRSLGETLGQVQGWYMLDRGQDKV